jgi:transcriptional regulator with XRE-family HTH domain
MYSRDAASAQRQGGPSARSSRAVAGPGHITPDVGTPSASTTVVSGLTAATGLKDFLINQRSRADRARLGVLPVERPDGSRHGITQEEAAYLMEVGVSWYGQLERGARTWTEGLVERLAGILDLADVDRQVLYYQALGWVPNPRPTDDEVDDSDIAFLHQLTVPAFVLDESLRVRHLNHALVEWDAFGPGVNIVEWIVSDPQARQRLLCWETDWRQPMLRQLRTSLLLSSGKTRAGLEAVAAGIVRDRDIAKLWESDFTLYTRQPDDVRRIEVDGQARSFVLTVACPIGRPGWRIISFGQVDAPPARLRIVS